MSSSNGENLFFFIYKIFTLADILSLMLRPGDRSMQYYLKKHCIKINPSSSVLISAGITPQRLNISEYNILESLEMTI